MPDPALLSRYLNMSSVPRKQIIYHKDGSVWANGEKKGDILTGYWEWFRKDGTKMRSGYFENGEQTGEWTTYDKERKGLQGDADEAQSEKADASRQNGLMSKMCSTAPPPALAIPCLGPVRCSHS